MSNSSTKRKETDDTKTTETTLPSSIIIDAELKISSEKEEFEKHYQNYYVDISRNIPNHFDYYLENALKLINCFPKIDWDKETKVKMVNLPEMASHKSKTIILDIDETLLHSDFDFQYHYHDEMLKFKPIKEEEEEELIPLILRPGLFKFLENLHKNFELIVFTASYKCYADVVLDYIERENKYFSKRLYRDHCIYLNPGLYIKDLSIFSNQRNLSNMIIVDNSLFSFANQLDNGILISSFYNDQTDTMLDNLSHYLNSVILAENDVRKPNREYFQYETYKTALQNEIDNKA